MEEHETPLPADWAIQAAIDRVYDIAPPTVGMVKFSPFPAFPALRELARMIEKHEEAPDPLVEDREFVAGMFDAGNMRGSGYTSRKGDMDAVVAKFMAYLRANVDKITGSA